MMRFDDDRALVHFHDTLGFPQDHFDEPWVFFLHPGDLLGEGGRGDRVEIDQLPFGLGDDLLGHDQDIAAAEGESQSLRRLNDHRGEIDARRDVCRTLQSDDAYFGSHQLTASWTFCSM